MVAVLVFALVFALVGVLGVLGDEFASKTRP